MRLARRIGRVFGDFTATVDGVKTQRAWGGGPLLIVDMVIEVADGLAGTVLDHDTGAFGEGHGEVAVEPGHVGVLQIVVQLGARHDGQEGGVDLPDRAVAESEEITERDVYRSARCTVPIHLETGIKKIELPWQGSIEFIPGNSYEKLQLL